MFRERTHRRVRSHGAAAVGRGRRQRTQDAARNAVRVMIGALSRWVLLCAAVLGALAIPAGAQSYPTRTVRVVFGLSAGSSSDVMARVVAERLGEKWGQAVIIDNRPGAGGNIAADAVAKSAPDGYTLLLSNVAIAIAPSYYRKLNYDPVKDLAPVTEL